MGKAVGDCGRAFGESGTCPNHPPSKKARPAGRAFSLGLGGGYPPMALSSEIDTPGPMVEHSEMPFM